MTDSQDPIAEESDDSDAIEAALEEAAAELGLGDDLKPESEEVEESPDAVEAKDDEPEVIEKPKRGRPKKEKVAEVKADDAEEETEETEISVEDGGSPDVGEDPTEDDTEAPPFWDEDTKGLFGKAPVALKKAIQEGFSTLGDHIVGLTEKTKQYEGIVGQIQKVFQPIESEMQAKGLDPIKLADRFVGWHSQISKRGVEAGLEFLNLYGITPEKLLRHFQAMERGETGYDAGVEDPRLTAKLSELESKTQGFEQWKTQQEEAFKTQRQAALRASVDEFKSERDASGQLKRPNVDMYEPMMAPVIQKLRAQYPQMSQRQLLDSAYQMVDKEMKKRLNVPARSPAQPIQSNGAVVKKKGPSEHAIRAKAAAGLAYKGSSVAKAKGKADSVEEAFNDSWDELGLN